MWQQLKYRLIQFADKFKRARVRVIEKAFQRWVLSSSFLEFDLHAHEEAFQRKQDFLNKIEKEKKIVFFCFRDLHWVDWFIPIHHALQESFSEEIEVFYINFASVLKRVGSGADHLQYRNQIEQRLLRNHVSSQHFFSHAELEFYKDFPRPDLILGTERIKQDVFPVKHRVYLPHYFVLKAKDVLPTNIRYNHIFLPSKPPFSYKEKKIEKSSEELQIHKVGYPKMDTPLREVKKKLFANDNPVVLYAPSLEVDILLSALQEGLLEVFQSMPNINFVIKLHPALGSRKHQIGRHFENETQGIPNILLDSLSSIQEVSGSSSLLIADFGNVGAEYRISFGKRVIYLKIPQNLEGGSDLRFRDQFADAVSSISDLKENIEKVLQQGDLGQEEWQIMGNQVLYAYGHAAKETSHAIANILEIKK